MHKVQKAEILISREVLIYDHFEVLISTVLGSIFCFVLQDY